MCGAYLNPTAGRPAWHIAGRNIVNPDKTTETVDLRHSTGAALPASDVASTPPPTPPPPALQPGGSAEPRQPEGGESKDSGSSSGDGGAGPLHKWQAPGAYEFHPEDMQARSSIPASWWCRPAQRCLAVFAGRQPQIASSDSHWRHRKRISIWNTECRRLHWQAPPPRRQPQPRTALHWPSAGRLTASARDFRRCGSAPASRRRPGSPRTPAGAVTA